MGNGFMFFQHYLSSRNLATLQPDNPLRCEIVISVVDNLILALNTCVLVRAPEFSNSGQQATKNMLWWKKLYLSALG